MSDFETCVSERVVSEKLGVSKKTLQRWRHEGIGPRFHKFGRSVRYDLADLEEYKQQSSRSSTSDTGQAHASAP